MKVAGIMLKALPGLPGLIVRAKCAPSALQDSTNFSNWAANDILLGILCLSTLSKVYHIKNA